MKWNAGNYFQPEIFQSYVPFSITLHAMVENIRFPFIIGGGGRCFFPIIYDMFGCEKLLIW